MGNEGFHSKFIFHVDTAFIAFFLWDIPCSEPRSSFVVELRGFQESWMCWVCVSEGTLGTPCCVWGSWGLCEVSVPCLSPGYEWPMVQEMSRLCHPLSQPVTFAVRAALVPGSIPQLRWLLQQSHRSVLLHPASRSSRGWASSATGQCQALDPHLCWPAGVKHSTVMCLCSSQWHWKYFFSRSFISATFQSIWFLRQKWSLIISLK